MKSQICKGAPTVHVPAIYLENFLEENLKLNTLHIHEMLLIDAFKDVMKQQLHKIRGNFNFKKCI